MTLPVLLENATREEESTEARIDVVLIDPEAPECPLYVRPANRKSTGGRPAGSCGPEHGTRCVSAFLGWSHVKVHEADHEADR